MTKAKLLPVLALVAVTAVATYAHHSLVANYFFDRTVTVEGTVEEFLLRNPHSFVRVERVDQAGRKEIWLAEWRSAGQLGRAGVFQETLRPGDRVIVTGNPSRDPAERKLHVMSIAQASGGWSWSEN